MQILLVINLIALALLFWLCIKTILMLDRQQHQNKIAEELKSSFEQKLNLIDNSIIGNNDKNTAILHNLIEKLSKLDATQNNIEKLNRVMESMQIIFNDKRSRGAFGETQLYNLVSNLIPEKYIKMQYTLRNGKRADCLILMPAPTNSVVIDAKFPLENFREMANFNDNEQEYLKYKRLFKKDIKHHIDAIAEKYILPPETADSAIMFIPAEAIFSEIHAYNPDIVEYAFRKRVWLTSPTTLMAILTTAASVIRDDCAQKNIDEVKEQIISLGVEFDRFNQRINNLFKHINMCSEDAQKAKISSEKISSRFRQIKEYDLQEQV